jgi:hypothetical protein
MEADWSVALGAMDPIIIVPWKSGEDEGECQFVDLRLSPHLVDEIEEARRKPALRSGLLLLNGAGSQVWTAKCDIWTSSVEQGDDPLDPYEMDAEPGSTAFGAGSYIDLLPRDFPAPGGLGAQERWLRQVTETLRATLSRAARVELVMRRAQVNAAAGFGVTWFVEGCGANPVEADRGWNQAFEAALAVILDVRMK